MKVVSIHIENFKVFKNVEINNIDQFAVFLGGNGSGKSTLFDVFSFIKQCLTENVRSALQSRGGYDEVRSRETNGDIKFIIKYMTSSDNSIFNYILQIGLNENKEPIVRYESLSKEEAGKDRIVFGRKGIFITYNKWQVEEFYNLTGDFPPEFKMSDEHLLALNIIGQMTEHQPAVDFRKYIEDWFVSDFHINAARQTQDISYIEQLSRSGDNLANVTQYLHDKHPKKYERILEKMKNKIPGISNVESKATEDGRILLRFSDGKFKDPFSARFVSDGTIKMFAYLVMLTDPNPHKLLCIEEPENQLYPHLLGVLAEEFREYSFAGGQVFISTHSPDFVNAIEPKELFIIKKHDGVSSINAASSDENIVSLYQNGDKLGVLWQEGLL